MFWLVEADFASTRAALEERGYAVRAVRTAADALHQLIADPGDVVVLDLGLPDLEGRELLKMLRAVSSVPVIVATAQDDEATIVRTLDLGADEYVVKPFSAAHLEARIRAVLRRAVAETAGEPITIGELTIDGARRRATLAGRDLELTRKEFDLLHHLAVKRGAVVTRKELLSEVWRQPF